VQVLNVAVTDFESVVAVGPIDAWRTGVPTPDSSSAKRVAQADSSARRVDTRCPVCGIDMPAFCRQAHLLYHQQQEPQ
jgi:hypothetical protein